MSGLCPRNSNPVALDGKDDVYVGTPSNVYRMKWPVNGGIERVTVTQLAGHRGHRRALEAPCAVGAPRPEFSTLNIIPQRECLAIGAFVDQHRRGFDLTRSAGRGEAKPSSSTRVATRAAHKQHLRGAARQGARTMRICRLQLGGPPAGARLLLAAVLDRVVVGACASAADSAFAAWGGRWAG